MINKNVSIALVNFVYRGDNSRSTYINFTLAMTKIISDKIACSQNILIL